MLAGLLFAPASTKAGFFQSIFGVETASATSSDPNTGNSQNIELLQVTSTGLGNFTPVISIVADNALMASTTPLSSEESIGGGVFSSEEVSFYVVRQGDTVAQVAQMFGITPDTIWSANEMPKGSKLKQGDVLLILPFSGVEHTVVKGDTLQGIANKYKVPLDNILTANELDPGDKLALGDKLVIPGGDMLNPAKPKATSTVKASGPAIKVANGYYINPVPGAVRTRGITSYHHGVDLAAPAGTPILAAAEGTVLIARNGYNGGFGNYVVIQHPNGTQTLYAHMSRLGTTPGARVSQGQVVGYVGNTGRSRGNHLHIEFKGVKNPL